MPTAIVFIPLTQGKVAVIDFEDMELVGRLKWCVFKSQRQIYAVRRPSTNEYVYMHRVILGLKEGDSEVDHKNGDGLDNRRENLRLVTHTQNMRAFRKRAKRYVSRFRGVQPNHKRWSAHIWHQGRIYLGTFDTEEEAAKAYDDAAMKYGFEKEALNFPQEVKDGSPEI